MNIDEVEIIRKLNKAAERAPLDLSDIRNNVWDKLDKYDNIIEVDSFSYIAVACAVAATVLLFLTVNIVSSLQSNVVWQLSESLNVFL